MSKMQRTVTCRRAGRALITEEYMRQEDRDRGRVRESVIVFAVRLMVRGRSFSVPHERLGRGGKAA